MPKPRIVLSVALHDPKQLLLRYLQRDYDPLKALYRDSIAEIVIVVSHATPPSMREDLRVAGYIVVEQDLPGLAAARRQCLRMALDAGAEWILFSDADRLIWWKMHHAHELATVMAKLVQYDFLVLGRTERAWNTHPPEQRETEHLVNSVVSLIYGSPVDVTAAARGLSRPAAEWISHLSVASDFATDSEWVVLAQRHPALACGYLEVDGLGYETGLMQSAQAIAESDWQAARSRDPHTWCHRTAIALNLISYAISTADRTLPI